MEQEERLRRLRARQGPATANFAQPATAAAQAPALAAAAEARMRAQEAHDDLVAEQRRQAAEAAATTAERARAQEAHDELLAQQRQQAAGEQDYEQVSTHDHVSMVVLVP